MGFWDDLQKNLAEGMEAGKDLLSKAADKARDLGEKGSVKWEIFQLSSQLEKATSRLGAEVFLRIRDQGQTLDPQESHLKLMLDEVAALKDKIQELQKKAQGGQE